jgi:tetratricopeptide (TPR) repeat protein
MTQSEPSHDWRRDPCSRASANLTEALDLHQAGQLAEAAATYRRVLEDDPGNADAWHFAGLLALQMDLPSLGIDQIRKAIELRPEEAAFYNSLGKVLALDGRTDEAMSALERAVAFDPNLLEAFLTLGNLHRQRGDLGQADASFCRAVAISPLSADGHCGLGNTYRGRGAWEEARASFEQALRSEPDHRSATLGMAKLLADLGEPEEAVSLLRREFKRKRNDGANDPKAETFRCTTEAKLRHDVEQFRYLEARGCCPTLLPGIAGEYQLVFDEIDWGGSHVVELSQTQRSRLATSYNRAVHLAHAPAIAGGPINPSLDRVAITASYLAHPPGAVYFDDFLTPEALASLRRFCLESTVWYDFGHHRGYLGAYLNDGFACPLLLQIAGQLRRTFPEIIGTHPLEHVWAFKYDSELRGISTHADFAALNVNFWITPDEANRDPDSGGLVIHRVEAPADWDFHDYNNNPDRIRTYVDAQKTAPPLVIPYRQNRAIIFCSSLFHETDDIRFKPGYENRRINITMLFGSRARTSPARS